MIGIGRERAAGPAGRGVESGALDRVSERSQASLGQLWNSNLVSGRAGRLVNHRRELVAAWDWMSRRWPGQRIPRRALRFGVLAR